MVFSAVTGVHTPITITEIPTQTVEAKQTSKSNQNESAARRVSTEQYVRNYFSDIPILAEVARCESHFRQFDKDGTVIRGIVNNADVGVMQINEKYHLDTATNENINIYTLEGNTLYARELYEKFGTDPWNSSRPCWGKASNMLATTVGQNK